MNFRREKNWRFQIDGKEMTVPVDGPFFVNSPEATRTMAVEGIGVAACPMYVVREDFRTGRLEPLLEAFEAHDFGVYAIYPPNRHLAARMRLLIDHLAASFRAV